MAINPNLAPPLPGGFIRDGQTDYSRMLVVNTDGSINVVASGSVPTGGSTAALQSSTQGAGATPGTAAVASTLVGGVYEATAPTLTDGQQAAVQLGSRGGLIVVGSVASGATDFGNPVKVGGVFTTTPTTLTTGQRGDLSLTATSEVRTYLTTATSTAADGASNTVGTVVANGGNSGRGFQIYNWSFNGTTWDRLRGDTNGLVMQPFAMTGSRWNYAAAAGGITNTTTAVTFIAAAGASVRNYVTAIQIDCGALGVGTEIAIRDGAGGTVLWRGSIGTAGYVNGRNIGFEVPLKGTANTLLEVVTLTATVTGAVYFNAQGFQGT